MTGSGPFETATLNLYVSGVAQFWTIKLLESPVTADTGQWKIDQDIITIGRLPENDCCIPKDLKISSVHSRLKFDGENILVDDLNSTNDTYLADDRGPVKVKGRTSCSNAVVLQVGSSRLEIRYHTGLSPNAKIRIENWQETMAGSMNAPAQLEAILVLDICKSTETANKHGDNQAFYMKTRLEEITESVFKKKVPSYIKSTGDGFFATYPTCEQALEAARLILQRLEYRNKKTEQLPINVRMALHHGKTYVIDQGTGDRHSGALNIAFKIEGVKGRDFITPVTDRLPEINRIIATRDFYSSLKENTNLFSGLGPYLIRGVVEPVDIFLFREDYVGTQFKTAPPGA